MAGPRELAAVFRARDEFSAEAGRINASLGRLESRFDDVGRSASSAGGPISSFAGSVGKIAVGVGLAEIGMDALRTSMSALSGAAIGMNASLETATLQFKVLMGDAQRAEEHVKGLFEFAKATPFESGPIIQASRTLEVFGGAALNTKETLKLVGDAAAGASAPIEEVAQWVARAYSAIQSGRPFGEAAQRLQELGLMSGESRAKIEALADAGVDGERVWAAFSGELGKFNGSMEELQGTWAGLTSTATDSINLLLSGALKPLFEEAKEGLAAFNRVLDSDEAKVWGESLANTVRTDVIPSIQEALRLARDAAQAIKDIPPARTPPTEPGGEPGGIDLGGALFRSSNPLGWLVLAKEQIGSFNQSVRGMGTEWAAMQRQMAVDSQAFMNDLKVLYEGGVEDIRLENSMMKRRITDPIIETIEDTIDAVHAINFGERLAQAFRLGDAADELGTGGADLLTALAEGIDKNSDKTANQVEQAARKIMARWLKELDPEEARRRGEALQAALVAGMTEDVEAQLRSGQQALDAKKAADAAAKEAEKANREAERVRKEQEREAARAVKEAERIMEQQRREAERAAELEAQRINTIRELGERRAEAIDTATRTYAVAKQKAFAKEDEAIAQALAQFAKEQEISRERERLQNEATKGIESFREGQAATRLGTQDTRAAQDRAIRHAREESDLMERRAKAAQTNAAAEAKAQSAINAARFGGNSIQVLQAMLAAQEARKQRTDQFAEEDRQLALRRQREQEDIDLTRARRTQDLADAKQAAAELAAEVERLNQPLKDFNQKIIEDNLAEKIQGYIKAKEEALAAASGVLGDQRGRIERQFAEGVERANNIGVPQTVILNNYNYGVQGPDAIHEMIAEDLAEAADALRVE